MPANKKDAKPGEKSKTVSRKKSATAKNTSKNESRLRRLQQSAEKNLSEQHEIIKNIPADDVRALIHELGVYRIELETQNEELLNTQQELEASRDRYFELYNFAPVGYLTIGKKGLISEINLTGADLFGVERDYLLGKRFSQFIAPESQDVFYHHRQRLLESGLKESCELTLLKQDGTPFDAHLDCIAIEDYDGNVSRIRATVTDITERKQAEKLVEEERQRLFSVLDMIPSFVYLQASDYTISFANSKFRELFGDPGDRHCYEVLRGRQTPCEACPTFRVFETKSPQTWEWDRGRDAYYIIYNYPFADSHGREMVLEFGLDITELKQTESFIRKLTHQLIKTQENERHMISLELHDRIAQDLIGIKYACETLLSDFPSLPEEIKKQCSNLLQMLQKTISEVRDLSYDLLPPGLDELGFIKTVYRYVQEFSEKTGLSVDFRSAGLEDLTFDYDTKINLYRMVQEGLNNVRKHADAGHITVSLQAFFPNIILRIKDDGKGFDVEKRRNEADTEKKMGLRSIEERTLLLKGEMTIRSTPANGTEITIEVPFEEKPDG